MAILPKWIVEDGSCVKGANTFAVPDDGRVYFPMRFGGEQWDPSFEGEGDMQPYCEEDICKALMGAVDVLKCFNYNPQPRGCKCCNNDLPNPDVCCDCDPCGNWIEKFKEAQLIIADAFLKGWRPWDTAGGVGSLHPEIMVDSMSRSGRSIKFSKPVSLAAIKRGKCATSSIITSEGLGQRLHSILKCYLVTDEQGIRVIS